MKNKALLILSLLSFSSFAQIQAVGDTMLGNDLKVADKLLSPVESILKNPNYINLINLEGVISNNNHSKKCSSGPYCYVFQMPDKISTILSNFNIHIANLANNHSMDLGAKGQQDTVASLLKNGVAPIGLSKDYTEKVTTLNGQEYVFIGVSPHKNTLSLFELEPIKAAIKQHKEENRLVVLTAHMGAEGENAYKVDNKEEFFLGANRGNPVKVAKDLIDVGADLFIAHGPHVMRPMELYKNRLIVYSLGNFLTYGAFNLNGKAGLGGLVRVYLEKDGSFKSGQFFGYQQTKNVDNKEWQKGNALIKSEKSLEFIKDMTQKHQKDAFKWDSEGRFFPKN